jgi:hypothetical protein
MFGFREIRLDIPMTAVAQSRLSRHKQGVPDFRCVNGVTGRASNAIGQVRRAHEVLVTLALLVTCQTPLTRLFCT